MSIRHWVFVHSQLEGDEFVVCGVKGQRSHTLRVIMTSIKDDDQYLELSLYFTYEVWKRDDFSATVCDMHCSISTHCQLEKDVSLFKDIVREAIKQANVEHPRLFQLARRTGVDFDKLVQ